MAASVRASEVFGDPFVRNAVVIDVHDGDTVTLDVDLGYFAHAHVPHRLYGINAPEIASIEGKKARGYLKSLLPVGTKVIVRSTKVKSDGIASDKYGGRFLANLFLADSGLNINKEMVAQGHAKDWDGKGVKPT